MVNRRYAARPIAGVPWRHKRWLILAPHPDDETLGVGALIAQTAEAGCLAGLVYLTDGSGSHSAQNVAGGHLISTRKREAALASRRLTGRTQPKLLFLGWKDASPEIAGGPAFKRSCRKLAALCVRLRVDVLATTAANEPHCDHAAAAGLVTTVRGIAKRRIAIADYIVWGEPPPVGTHRALISRPLWPGLRRLALAAHRSQLTASFGVGFRLPKNKRSMAMQDLLYLRKS